MRALIFLILMSFSFSSFAANREWTMMVFLNGHNNLDKFGWDDVNEMERIGSTDKVTVLVQWASEKNKTTKRLLITKDLSGDIKSTVLEELPRVDMGDPAMLVEFVRWAKQNFPADNYFLDVWNHGGGWHNITKFSFQPQDISWDDFTGNSISTEELGVAMDEIRTILGKKLDLLGMDACLMSMVEVAAEVASGVSYMASSQEVEPGEGWDYEGLLLDMNRSVVLDAKTLGRIVADSFVRSYSGGSQGTRDVTFSILDLSQLGPLKQALRNLAAQWNGLAETGVKELKLIAGRALSFDFPDYLDIGDFLKLAKKSSLRELAGVDTASVMSRLQKVVIYQNNSPAFSRANGLSIWVPLYQYQLDNFKDRYRGLIFNQDTQWLDVVTRLNSVR